jgi:hypothetical protein
VSSIRALRAAGQLLQRPDGFGPVEIVRRLLAVQSQDLNQGRRALRARGTGFTAADVDHAIVEDGSIVVAWVNRGTIHMVSREDYPWLWGLTAPTQAAHSRRRLAQEGVTDPERGIQAITRALGSGPLARRELRERVAAKDVPVAGQAFLHQLFAAALRGLVVIGPHGVELVEAPPPALEGEERERALAELAVRYLAAHGPALEADLAWWAGLPLRDARAGLRASSRRIVELDGGLVDLRRPVRPEAPGRFPLRLLPMWDAYLLGWKERSFLAAGDHLPRVYREGMVGPAVAVNGLVSGTWKARRDGKRRLVTEVEAFRRLPSRQLAAELEDLARFEGAA